MKKILIIDDEAAIRELLGRVLKAANYEVIAAQDGLEGLEKAKELIPDLIISDVLMPQLDGITLCSLLKRYPPTAHIPILLVTTQVKIGQVDEAMKEKADGYLTKPFEMSRILKKVETFLS